mmetsp:Transcript_99496/g.276823  ORF Transcript_99496/g.276823 Transcript_99496/m.276823 type:complete len:214 (-) Transcript_99496:22-663(-)
MDAAWRALLASGVASSGVGRGLRPEHSELAEPARLRRAFGDSLEKVLWRSRLVLDFAAAADEVLRLFQTASTGEARAANSARRVACGSKYMLWLEDDVELQDGFGSLMAEWLREHGAREDWLALRLMGFERDPDPQTWSWGTAGWGGGGVMLLNGVHLGAYGRFLRSAFDAAPLDWLVDHVPPPAGVAAWWRPRLRPVLLRHLGEHSTHEGFV